MAEAVFILGAGASKECGAPLMANFLDVADDLRLRGEAGIDAVHFERVFALAELEDHLELEQI